VLVGGSTRILKIQQLVRDFFNGKVLARCFFCFSYVHYLPCHLVSGEGLVTLGVTLCVCVCVRRISLGGEGNALYPVLSSFLSVHWPTSAVTKETIQRLCMST